MSATADSECSVRFRYWGRLYAITTTAALVRRRPSPACAAGAPRPWKGDNGSRSDSHTRQERERAKK